VENTPTTTTATITIAPEEENPGLPSLSSKKTKSMSNDDQEKRTIQKGGDQGEENRGVDSVESPIQENKVEENLGSSSSLSKKMRSIEDHGQEQSNLQNGSHKGIESRGADSIESPFQEKTVQILVSLPPSSLTNIPNALNESIQKLLLKYSNSLGGVLVSFRDVELDSKENGGGRIINEMPHIHYNVRCSVMVFNPTIGTVLSGKVNESFPSHVGVLVYELFNAMISSESLKQNGFVFDDETNEWRRSSDMDDDDDLVGRVVNIGDGMKFTVDKLHECNGLISLECTDPAFITTTEQWKGS